RWPDPVLSFDRLDLGVAWAPLLTGSVELVGAVDDMQIYVAQDTAGSNLESMLTVTATAPDEQTAATDHTDMSALPPVRLQSLSMEPVNVIFCDQATSPESRYALAKARISLSNVAPGATARLFAALPIELARRDLQANGTIRVAVDAALPDLDALTAPVPFNVDVDASALDLDLPGIAHRSAGDDLRLTASGQTHPDAEFGVWMNPLRVRITGLDVEPEAAGIESLHVAALDAMAVVTAPSSDTRLSARLDLRGRSAPASFTLPLTIAVRGPLALTSASCRACTFTLASDGARIELDQTQEPARVALDLAAAGQAFLRQGNIDHASVGLSGASHIQDLAWTTPVTVVSGNGAINLTASTEIIDNAPTNLRADLRANLDHLRVWLADTLDKPAGERLRLNATAEAPSPQRGRGTIAILSDGLTLDGHLALKDAQQRFASRITASLAGGSPASHWILQRPDLVTRSTLAIDATSSGELSRPATLRLDGKINGQIGSSDLEAHLWLMDLDSPTIDIDVRSRRIDLDELAGSDANGNEAEAAKASTPTAPEEEFRLASTDLATLRPLTLTLQARTGDLILDGTTYDDAELQLLLAHGKLTVKKMDVGMFGGRASGSLDADLNTYPLEWAAQLHLTNIQTEPLIALYEPKHRKLLQAGADLDLDVAAIGTTSASIRRHLTGTGTFLLHDGQLNTISLASEIESQFDAFVRELSIVDAAGDLFSTAEKLMRTPVVQRSAAARNANPAVWRKKYDAFRSFSLAGLLSVDKGIRDTAGELTFRDGHLLITALNESPSGRYDVRATVAPDDRLSGAAEYVASATVRQKMLARSPYAALLFDDGGNFRLRMKLRGSLTDPSVGLDLTPIRDGFRARSRERVRQDVLLPLQQAAKELVTGSVPDAKKIIEQPREQAKDAARKAKEATGNVRSQARDAVNKVGKKLFGR
ncbi:MAG: AsmA family protein, partial [Candidatus Dadabacteria bacterium]